MIENKDFELLKIYYDEWKFRQESLWKRMVQFFVIIFFVSTLPITITHFDGVELPNMSLVIFPLAGIALSIFYLWFCLAESYRIKANDIKIETIKRNIFDEEYCKNGLVPLLDKNIAKEVPRIFTMRMAVWVPTFLFIIQIIIAVFMLALIVTKRIV